jgi:hypothetical protein
MLEFNILRNFGKVFFDRHMYKICPFSSIHSARFIQIGKKIRTFFLGHLYSFPIQGKFTEESKFGEKKIKKVFGLESAFY